MAIKILLADDEEDLEDLFRQQFRHKIQNNIYEFYFARNGWDALAILEQQPEIDIFISDINMPGMDGLTLLDKVSVMYPAIRTVILTAYGDMRNIRTAMNRGAFDFLIKPVDFADMEATLTKTIRAANHYRESMELRAINAMKTRFFTNITHELRTPLSLILVLIDKLQDSLHLPLIYQQPLAAIQRNVRQLLRLINQLLDINKLEAGNMELTNEVGDLPSFVEQIVELFSPAADIKQLRLTYHTDLASGNYLFDADKWEKILYNLLSNAIKFTETGHIKVTLTHTPIITRLSVSDTGIGIAANKLSHIFDRFYQVDQSRSRAYEGTGIGLALVRELTSRLGGSVRVQSQTKGGQEPSGTEFVVDIPIRQVDISASAQSLPSPTLSVELPYQVSEQFSVPEPSLSEQTPLVLIVEDNTELRAFLVAELATTYRVRSAANGQEGLELAKEELPDVIISDLMMPQMDGYQLLVQLRTDPATDHIAVVLLTARVEEGSQLKGLTYGADDYLTKPFNLAELRLRLRNLLTRQAKLAEEYRRQFTQSEKATPLETMQDPFLRRFYQLLETHLDDSSLSVEWLADELAINRKKLYRKVQTLVHLSPKELITQYRLRKAVDLLRFGHNISETAYLTGFETPSYFTKVFRDFYQQTPSDYLKK